jgi:hypothetical protein
MDEVVYNMSEAEAKEFSQQHIDECISSVREIKDDEFEALFNKDNDYLKDSKRSLKEKGLLML